jgi:hypothetical protein
LKTLFPIYIWSYKNWHNVYRKFKICFNVF